MSDCLYFVRYWAICVLRWNKKHFSSFLKAFSGRKLSQTLECVFNRFCPLSQNPSPTLPPALHGQYQDWYNTNQNRLKNTCPFYIVFQFFKVLLINLLRYRYYHFYFLLFLLSFTSTDIILDKFLEIHSTLSEKKDFCHRFSFFNRFTQTPPSP